MRSKALSAPERALLKHILLCWVNCPVVALPWPDPGYINTAVTTTKTETKTKTETLKAKNSPAKRFGQLDEALIQ